ncbi:Integrase-type DNA-binding superfamily protein [Rhynchospora pubera]|uniref:Integrase-type DNA-binding superfamily protein n=1 Tax=Rhynchospora pubera TaxID=906938 RepID=A0AAV8FVC9_9POAL|nr:Integrase-type DNA-binding superfamily protein [Rhynchospora pubera]
MASSSAGNSSDKKYTGVTEKKPGQWQAQICIPYNVEPRVVDCPSPLWLGYFESKEKAARAYDVGTVCVHGSQPDVLRGLYFPDTPPALPYPEDQKLTVEQVKLEARNHANRDDIEPAVQPAQDTRGQEKGKKHCDIGMDAIVSRPSTTKYFDFMGVGDSAPAPKAVGPAVEPFIDFMGVSPMVPKKPNNAEKEDQDFDQ